MSDTYDFDNLSPIEFEALCVDLLSQETGLDFERFSSGSDGGIDGRHSSAAGERILQAKHYKGSTWSDLKRAATTEHRNIVQLSPSEYHFHTSQPLTPTRKRVLHGLLNHSSVSEGRIWGKSEINDRIRKHPKVERRHIKLWLSSAAVLEKIVHNNVAIFTEATQEEIARVLRVYVENPSLDKAAKVLERRHSLIISGPPGVGKTTLAQVLAAEYCDEGWELVAISDIEQAFAVFNSDERQVFVFDDFLGKIRLDPFDLAKSDGKILRLIASVQKQKNKRFIMTTRGYVFHKAQELSEYLSEDKVVLSEVVLDLSTYTREIKARILYNHLYHSDLPSRAVYALVSGGYPKKIVDHKNYMPRIVQWMTDLSGIEGIVDEDYPNYFLRTLNNPDKVWERAFRKHISHSAQVLLIAMYFSERAIFPTPGVALDGLKELYVSIISVNSSKGAPIFRDQEFKDALKELESSFITLEGQRANFINPSLLDFLAKEVGDRDILEMMAAGACHLEEIRNIWGAAEATFSEDSDARLAVARSIQQRILSGPLKGRMPLRKAVHLLGDLLLAHPNNNIVAFLRAGRFGEHVWVNEVDLIEVIEDLEERKYRKLDHSRSYARALRTQVSKYVVDREYVLEIEEIAGFFEKLSECYVEFPQQFNDALEEAAAESVDSLDPHGSSAQEDPETVLGGWLEEIEKIEANSGFGVDRSKKREIEECLGAYEAHKQGLMDEYREREHFKGFSSGSNPLLATDTKVEQRFTDGDLNSLFSSLHMNRG